MKESRANSVRNLENLYSVVAGLGLSLSILNLIDTTRRPVPVKLELLPLFCAFVITLIPFYHGALRHLDVTYIEKGAKQVRNGALLADFALLFIESCLLLALAVLLPIPRFFAWGLVLLLVIDAFWGFAAHIAFSQQSNLKAEPRWALINLASAVFLVIYLVNVCKSPLSEGDRPLWAGILGMTVLRTVIDYCICWKFYFPSN